MKEAQPSTYHYEAKKAGFDDKHVVYLTIDIATLFFGRPEYRPEFKKFNTTKA